MVAPVLITVLAMVLAVAMWAVRMAEVQRAVDVVVREAARSSRPMAERLALVRAGLTPERVGAGLEVSPGEVGGGPAVVASVRVPLRVGAWVTALNATVTSAATVESS